MISDYKIGQFERQTEYGNQPSVDPVGFLVPGKARIAIYDDFLSAPRIIDIDSAPIDEYIESIASNTYEYAQKLGGEIAYSAIREITENFIHADFKECTVSILNNGNMIRFSDQGPGITRKDLVQKPGFTSATQEMKPYIRGVGSGFPIVKEYLSYKKGLLTIDDNVNSGAVITIMVEPSSHTTPQPAVQASATDNKTAPIILEKREHDALLFLYDEGMSGPSEIARALNTSTSTAYRVLERLESKGFVTLTKNKKRILSNSGHEYVRSLT